MRSMRSALALGFLQLIWGPVQCSPAARAARFRCPQAPSARPSALALGLLALFAVVGARGFRIAVRHQDPFARLLAFGVTLSLVLQGVVNAGVVLGCLPTKGLALPFLSYGGSAMIAALGQIGVLLALARESG